MTPKKFVAALQAYEEERVFNPYLNNCAVFDRAKASEIRSKNLWRLLVAMQKSELDAIWIGRDLGYRGGRRTGLALTDEARFEMAQKRWGIKLDRATKGEPVAERTANNIWMLLEVIEVPVFMWNVFPFHPHEQGKPFTNRAHTAIERDKGVELLAIVVAMLKPKRLVAIGNDAYRIAEREFSYLPVHKVRHPSYGGEKDFERQLRKLYGI